MRIENKSGYLYHVKPDGTFGEAWEITAKPVVVGRGDFADALIEDETLSRSHFLIVHEGPDIILVDLSSSNGTLVNGKRVTAHRLASNEIIQAGASTFCYISGFRISENDASKNPLLALRQAARKTGPVRTVHFPA